MDTRDAGRKGNEERNKRLTPKQRHDIAAKAAAHRWKGHKKKNDKP